MEIIKCLKCTLHTEGISHGCLSDPSRHAASLSPPNTEKDQSTFLRGASRASQGEKRPRFRWNLNPEGNEQRSDYRLQKPRKKLDTFRFSPTRPQNMPIFLFLQRLAGLHD